MEHYQRPIRPDELLHYGVKGMKWGVRRYQNYDGTRIYSSVSGSKKRPVSGINYRQATKSKRAIKRSLKYLERQRTQNLADANTANKKADSLSKAGNVSKAQEYASRGKAHLENVKEIDNVIQNTMNAASERGYTVVGRKAYTQVMSDAGKATAALTGFTFGLSGLPLAITEGVIDSALHPERRVETMKYKVASNEAQAQKYRQQAIDKTLKVKEKEAKREATWGPSGYKNQTREEQRASGSDFDGDGKIAKRLLEEKNAPAARQQARTESAKKMLGGLIFSDSQKRTALNNAKKKDLYDINFLEATQNKEYSEGAKGQAERLADYKKYLDDPEEFWKNR